MFSGCNIGGKSGETLGCITVYYGTWINSKPPAVLVTVFCCVSGAAQSPVSHSVQRWRNCHGLCSVLGIKVDICTISGKCSISHHSIPLKQHVIKELWFWSLERLEKMPALNVSTLKPRSNHSTLYVALLQLGHSHIKAHRENLYRVVLTLSFYF